MLRFSIHNLLHNRFKKKLFLPTAGNVDNEDNRKMEIIEDIGYDNNWGRVGVAAHTL